VKRLKGLVLAVLWLAAAGLFALGAAGLVSGVGGAPGTPARAELTSAGDRAIAPGLAAATEDLQALADALAGLGDSARTALTAVIATDTTLLASSVDEGTVKLGGILDRTTTLRRSLLGLPGVSADSVDPLPPAAAVSLSAPTRERFRTVLQALDVMIGLPVDWARFSSGALAAQRLTTSLLDHDTATADAAGLGRTGDYAGALAGLDTSDRLVADARRLRTILANNVDVTTLDEWLDRNADYDVALRELYTALQASDGRVTDEVREAFDAEQAARERLPPDTRGLTIILAEIARGGMNEAAIGIEHARAELDSAIAASTAIEAAPSAAPASSPSPTS
jgi:hypothetical protein